MKNLAALLVYLVIGITALPAICMASPKFLQCNMQGACDKKKECKKEHCPVRACCNCCCFCCFMGSLTEKDVQLKLNSSADEKAGTDGAFALSGFTSDCWQPPEKGSRTKGIQGTSVMYLDSLQYCIS